MEEERPVSPEEGIAIVGSDTGGLEDSLQIEGDRPALNTVDGVDGALRAFAAKIIAFRGEWLKDPTKPVDAVAFLEAEARAMADAFMGRTQQYYTTAWNSPEQLGTFIGARVGISGDPEEVVETYFFRLGRTILDIAVAHEDRRTDEETTKFALDTTFEEAVHVLLGLPPIDAS